MGVAARETARQCHPGQTKANSGVKAKVGLSLHTDGEAGNMAQAV